MFRMYIIRIILFSFAIIANLSPVSASADPEELSPGAYFSVFCEGIHDEITLSTCESLTVFKDFSLRIAAGKPLKEAVLLSEIEADKQRVTRVKSVRLKSNCAVTAYSRCKNENAVSTVFPLETYEESDSPSKCLYEKGFTIYLSGTRVKQGKDPKREIFSAMHLEFPADGNFSADDSFQLYLRLLKIQINMDTKKPVFEMELEQVKRNGVALWAIIQPKCCIDALYGVSLK